jgi:hypothetical protein
MNGKWRKFAIIGILVLDICLVAVRVESLSNQGGDASSWAKDLTIQKTHLQEISFGPGFIRLQTAEKLTATTVFLLTAMILM